MIKRLIRQAINAADRAFGLRELMREESAAAVPLAGDRAIEWSWVVAQLPKAPSRILDLGCVDSVLSCVSARLGHRVTAVDLRDIEYDMEGIAFRRGDINRLDLAEDRFDAIINASMIEHVGLAGRFGADESPDGDLLTMRHLAQRLAPGGVMILTIPVGRDAVCKPYHRIYGRHRLPLLLQGYDLQGEEYWTKPRQQRWEKTDRQQAIDTVGARDFYALGLFVLTRTAALPSGAPAA